MDTQIWRKARPIFERAAELPPNERSAFLGSACGQDDDLKSAVRTLLHYDETSELKFKPALEDLRVSMEEPEARVRLGRQIGPYRLTRCLGRGGMGEVFLGERVDEDLHLRVAVKLLRTERYSEGFLRRFRAERQILANLDHPNIAKLIDAGTTDDGEPYLVMEFIDGRPLLDYCDAHKLDVQQRLHLFCQVCRAVQHAHRNLVIHRDIKSKNILVDKEGNPRLLDFGIAKLMGPVIGLDSCDDTHTGIRVLTPYNASPEQLRGERIATASDIFALGILLYELLCGFRAHEGEDARAIIESIMTLEPSPPSFRLALAARKTPAAAEELAGSRSCSSLRPLRRLISGDLDAITMRAIAKEPGRRYPSVDSLLQDLDCYRAGMPIAARPGEKWYRAKKWLSRHRWATAFAGTLLAALIAAIPMVFYHIQKVGQERNQALMAQAKAEEVTRVLIESFELYNPAYNLEGIADTKGLLQGITARIDAGLLEQPALKATLLNTMGGAYANLGHYEVAKPLLDRAMALHRGQNQPDLRTTAELYTNFGHLHMALGHYAAAQRSFNEALDFHRQRRPHDDIAVMEGMRLLASAHYRLGDYDIAERFLQEARNIGRPLPREQLWRDGRILNDLGLLLLERGKNRESLELTERALALYRDIFDEDNSEVAITLNNMGLAYRAMNEFSMAEKRLTEAWQVQSRVLGEDHPLSLQFLNNIALILVQQNRFEDAEERFKEVMAGQKRVLGQDHLEVARTLNNLSLLYIMRRDLTEAVPLLRRSVGIQRLYLEGGPGLSAPLMNLGMSQTLLGNWKAGEASLREAYQIDRCYLGEDHPDTGMDLLFLADAVARGGLYREAHGQVLASLQVLYGQDPVDLWRIAFAESVYGLCLGGMGRYEEGESYLEDSLQRIIDLKGQDSLNARSALQRMAIFYDLWGKYDIAEIYRQGIGRL